MYIYQESAVDTGATCQLVGEESLPYLTNLEESCMKVGGFHEDSVAYGSAHGQLHPHFFTLRLKFGYTL